MDLNTLWFVLVGVLFAGFFVLEGFDYGVGILLPFVARDEPERRRVLNTIGPFWDGNEVWVLTAGGAIFAAFPDWYATLFSGFYLALFLMLVALIIRGVGIELRSKFPLAWMRRTAEWMVFSGSALAALLWGVALANLLYGVPIDGQKNFTGNLLTLLNPYALLAGLSTLTLFTTHGAIFLSLRTTTVICDRSMALTRKVGPVATVLTLASVAATFLFTDTFRGFGINPGMVPILAFLSLIATGLLTHRGRIGWSFVTMSLTMVFTVASVFSALYPRVMVSSLGPEFDLTIYNASSSHYTLTLMSIVALCTVPLVLVYQGWSYWVFRRRIGVKTRLVY